MVRKPRQLWSRFRVVPPWGLGCVLASLIATTAEHTRGTNSSTLTLIHPIGDGHTGFSRLDPAVIGIRFTNRVSDQVVAINRIMENGSGVALGDVDGDGWCDVYLTGLEEPNHLYRNLGNWRFEDITGRAGVACDGQFSTGAVFADVDGDGDLDLLVNGIGTGTRLFLNDGSGKFRESLDSGLNRSGGSHSLALADADGDGDLDLYVTNYRTTTFKDLPAGETREVKMVGGKPVVKPADRWLAIVSRPPAGVTLIELGEPDVYYRNDGKGRFTAVEWTDGTFQDEEGRALKEPPRDWGLSVLFRDLNGDGFPDLYVCNDFYYSRDRIWMNDGHGRFRAIAPLKLRSMPETSMAADVGDINADGLDDLLVMDMLPRNHLDRQTRWDNMWKQVVAGPVDDPAYTPEYPRNMLFLNRGDGTWAEIARLAGIEATGWSWSALFMDVDLDGYPDILVTTGHGRDMMQADVVRSIGPVPPGTDVQGRLRLYRKYAPLMLENLAFHNNNDLTFSECGKEWGFNRKGVSHGIALADLDNDGDLDVVVNEYRDTVSVYRNDTAAPRLAVRLRGVPPNTGGVGARVRVTGGPVLQSAEVVSGGRYLSGDDLTHSFAAGSSNAEMEVEVRWRSGAVRRITSVPANRLLEIEELRESLGGIATRLSAPLQENVRLTLFEDITELLVGYVQSDGSFDDYERQPLLPRKLSHAGPGLGWFDLNRDGWDDLVVGSGKGGIFAVFGNREGTSFQLVPGTRLPNAMHGLLGWMASPERPLLLTAISSYEPEGQAKRFSTIEAFDPQGGANGTLINDFPCDVGELALADIDADGDLDLFVAGRLIPGRYPEAASCRLYRNERGSFTFDDTLSSVFDHVGLVNGATFSDLNGDGYPDLILACEWGPVRVFGNVRGQFVEQTKALGLAEWTGLWQGVATGDFDGDGRLDIVASNWGRNGESQPKEGRPVSLWAGDLAGIGAVDIIETEWNEERNDWAPRRNLDTLAAPIPWLRGEFSSTAAFGRSTLKEIFKERLTNAIVYRVSTLESSLFLSKGGKFERSPLPVEAQFTPAFGVSIGDFNGDGREDLFLAQNFFPVATDRSRHDSGQGLLLLGDGMGRFHSVAAGESGIRIWGEQRAAAVSDFDHDGRLDLAVAQNRGPIRLFRNRTGKPSLRVRLSGGPGNVDIVGTQIAAITADNRRGLIREVRAGSGYWSQDSVVMLVPAAEAVKQLWIRWPRGKQLKISIPEGAKEVSVTGLGEVKVLR